MIVINERQSVEVEPGDERNQPRCDSVVLYRDGMVARCLSVLVGVLLLAACGGAPSASRTPTEPTSPRTTSVWSTSTNPVVATGAPAPAANASAECQAAMRTIAAGPDVAATDPTMTATLTECKDVPEWLRAVSENPGAFGLSPGTEVGIIEVEIACTAQNRELPVCADAARRGLLPGA